MSRMSYLPKELRMEKLLELLIAGLNLSECAEQLRVTPWTVGQYVKEEGFLDLLKEKSSDAYSRLAGEIQDTAVDSVRNMEAAAEMALDEMIALCQNGKTELTRFKAAQDIMDRDPRLSRTKRLEGSGAKTQNNVINAVFLKQAITAMKEEEERTA